MSSRARSSSKIVAALVLGLCLWTGQAQAQDEAEEDDLAENDEETGAAASESAVAKPSPGALEDSAAVEAARAHFQRGVDYYGEGDYRAALIEFERAYALQHAYRLLYNLGQTAYELKDYAAAERYFRDYLAQGGEELDAGRRAEVKAELERLQTRVSSLRIQSSLAGATIRVDERVVHENENGVVRVSAGARRVMAEKSGYAPVTKVVDVVGGEVLTVALDFGPVLVATDAARAQSGPSAWPWAIGIATGVVALTAGGFSYAAYRDSVSYNEQLQVLTTQRRLDDLSAGLQTKALVADVLWGTAAVGAAVTLVMVVTGGEPDKQSEAQRGLGLRLTGSSLRVHF